MTVTDSNGNISGYDTKTNTTVSNINNVYYKQIGDTKLLIVPENMNHTINLSGYDNGVYTLNVDTYNNDGLPLATTTFYSIPTTPNSQSYLKHDILSTTTDSLLLDYNNNGKVDGIISPSINNNSVTYTASTTLSDTIPTSEYLYYLDQVQTVENPPIPIVKTRATTSMPKVIIPPRPVPIIKLIKKI